MLSLNAGKRRPAFRQRSGSLFSGVWTPLPSLLVSNMFIFLADITERIRDVRFTPRSRHVHRRHRCLQSARSGHHTSLPTMEIRLEYAFLVILIALHKWNAQWLQRCDMKNGIVTVLTGAVMAVLATHAASAKPTQVGGFRPRLMRGLRRERRSKRLPASPPIWIDHELPCNRGEWARNTQPSDSVASRASGCWRQ